MGNEFKFPNLLNQTQYMKERNKMAEARNNEMTNTAFYILVMTEYKKTIKKEYYNCLREGLSAEKAKEKVLGLHPNEVHQSISGVIVWLGLAYAEAIYGRLDEDTKARALLFLQEGERRGVWTETELKASREGRNIIEWHQELRELLNHPKEEVKVPRKRPPYICDWKDGDVYAYKLNDRCAYDRSFAGRYALFQKVDVFTYDDGETVPLVLTKITKDNNLSVSQEKFNLLDYVRVSTCFKDQKPVYRSILCGCNRRSIQSHLEYIGNFAIGELPEETEFRGDYKYRYYLDDNLTDSLVRDYCYDQLAKKDAYEDYRINGNKNARMGDAKIYRFSNTEVCVRFMLEYKRIIKEEYYYYLRQGMNSENAKAEIVKLHEKEMQSAISEAIVWLGLAYAEAAYGRLDEETTRKAIKVLDEGESKGLWVQSELEKTRAGKKVISWFQELREQLNTPQKEEKIARKQLPYVCDWKQGDVYAFRLDGSCDYDPGYAGRYALFQKTYAIKFKDDGETVPVVAVKITERKEIPQSQEEFDALEYVKVMLDGNRTGYNVLLIDCNKRAIKKYLEYAGNFKIGLLQEEVDLGKKFKALRLKKYVTDILVRTYAFFNLGKVDAYHDYYVKTALYELDSNRYAKKRFEQAKIFGK